MQLLLADIGLNKQIREQARHAPILFSFSGRLAWGCV
jgi:hypothetical protein